jgi:phage RecT family recombinase
VSDRTQSSASREQAGKEQLMVLLSQAEQKRVEFQALLPSEVPWEVFKDTFKIAIQRNMRLMEADRQSLWVALQRAALDGLKPDGREGALVIFGDDSEDEEGRVVQSNANRKKMVQWMPMVAGIIKLVRNTGDVAGVHATLVYRGEEFSYVEEDGEVHFRHVRKMDPDFDDSPANIVGAYAVVNYKDGTWEIEPISRRQIERVRAVSKAKKGPWGPWYDEMAKKTVLRRLCKRLDQSPVQRVVAALDRDDELTIDGDAPEPGRNLVPAPPPPRRNSGIAGEERERHPSDRQPIRGDVNNTRGAETRQGVGSAATPARSGIGDGPDPVPPADEPSGVTSPGGEQPGTFLVYATDEFGEPVMNGGEYQTFTTPLAFVQWFEGVAAKAANVTALFEHNADAIDEAMAADKSLSVRLDPLLKVGGEPTKPDDGPPQPIPAPAKTASKGWADYLETARAQIAQIQSADGLADWKHLNMDTYLGKAAEIGINKAIAERSLAFPQPDRDAIQADGFIAGIKACATRAALSTYHSNGAFSFKMDRWKTSHPQLWEKVNRAGEDKLAEFNGGTA